MTLTHPTHDPLRNFTAEGSVSTSPQLSDPTPRLLESTEATSARMIASQDALVALLAADLGAAEAALGLHHPVTAGAAVLPHPLGAHPEAAEDTVDTALHHQSVGALPLLCARPATTTAIRVLAAALALTHLATGAGVRLLLAEATASVVGTLALPLVAGVT